MSNVVELYTWLSADLRTMGALRKALDANGGQSIRLDYNLTIPMLLLRDRTEIRKIVGQLTDAPIGNIWLRVSGFGMKGSPAGTRRYIEAAWDLGETGKPLIADNVGGVVGLSLAAFGAAGGICQGPAERESFNVRNWRNPPSGGGPKRRIYIPQLDLYLTQDKALRFLKGRGGVRSLVLCRDCCHGADDMVMNFRLHAITQNYRIIEELNKQPELKRPSYVLDEVLPSVGRVVRKAVRVKTGDDHLTRTLRKQSDRTDLLSSTLESLAADRGVIPISQPITDRWLVNRAG